MVPGKGLSPWQKKRPYGVPAASPGRLQDREDHVHHTQGYQLNGDASEVFGDSRMEDFLAEGIVEYQHEKDTDNCAQPFRYMVQD